MSYEELKRWAKTVELPDPVRWGDIEARILTEPKPVREELDAMFPEKSRARWVLKWLLIVLLVLPEAVVVVGSPAVGLGLVIAYVGYDRELPSGFDPILQLLFIAAVFTGIIPVMIFWTEKRRGGMSLSLTLGTAIASAASWVLLGTSPDLLLGVWHSLQFLSMIAALAGLVSFVFLLVAGKPSPRARFREQWRPVPAEEKWLRGMRAGVLEELLKRGVVNDADSTAIIDLPVGAWQELESLPGGRVVRNT